MDVSRLHLVFAEAALELVPEPLWSHPAVSKSARARSKRPRDLLLDDTYHHSAMRSAAKKGQFGDAERRGRPDIVHFCLLVALESRLNHEGRLGLVVHTRNDQLIRIDPTVRVQRAQHRFAGLMEQLLQDHAVPTPEKGPPLMQLEDSVSLANVVKSTGARRVVVLEEKGETDARLEAALADDVAPGEDVAVVVGGFPHGSIQSDLTSIPHRTIRLGDEPLTAWTVTGEVLVRYRQARATTQPSRTT